MWPFGNTRRAPRPNRKPREGSVAAFPYQNAPNFKSTRGFSCKRKGGPNSPFNNGYYARYNGSTEPPDGWIEKHCNVSQTSITENSVNGPNSQSNTDSVASDPGSASSVVSKSTAKVRARNAKIAHKYSLNSANRKQRNLREYLKEHPHV